MTRNDPAEQRIGPILDQLNQTYTNPQCALNHQNAYQLLVATILSAQCTDARVNMVTPAFFQKYPDPNALAKAAREDIEEAIRSTGFFRNKAKSLQECANAILEKHQGQVPDSMETLTALPGIGRKTANVILGNAFKIESGIVVDTHVRRLSNRLGLSDKSDPDKIEKDLMNIVPKGHWIDFSHQLILHGRQICNARKPKCSQCPLADLCPSAEESDV